LIEQYDNVDVDLTRVPMPLIEAEVARRDRMMRNAYPAMWFISRYWLWAYALVMTAWTLY
jgi:hypothetical protein